MSAASTKKVEKIKEAWYHTSPSRLYDICVEKIVNNIDILLVKNEPCQCQKNPKLLLNDKCGQSKESKKNIAEKEEQIKVTKLQTKHTSHCHHHCHTCSSKLSNIKQIRKNKIDNSSIQKVSNKGEIEYELTLFNIKEPFAHNKNTYPMSKSHAISLAFNDELMIL